MSESTLKDKLKVRPAIISAVMLLLALFPWPYGYYILLRLIVCPSAIYLVYLCYKAHRDWAPWYWGFVAILFNPLILVELNRGLWVLIDIIVAVSFIRAVINLKPVNIKSKNIDVD